MRAIFDFRADNGTTLVVLGSYKWPVDRIADPDEIISVEMSAGSLFFWLGGSVARWLGGSVALWHAA